MTYYTTDEVAKLTPYKTRRTLLQALHNNHRIKAELQQAKLIETCTDNQYRLTERFNELHYNTLSKIWDTRFKFGRRWLFETYGINQILKGDVT